MNKRILKIIAVTITVVLAGFTFVFMLRYSREFREERESLAEIAGPVNDSLVRLMVKKSELEQQLSDMDEKIELADDRMGSIVFLFTEPEKEILTDIVPVMDKYGYPGVIAISTRYYPGVEGCLGWDDIQTLTDKGWELCVSADDVSDVDMLKAIFKKGNVDLPTTVYYPQDRCSRIEEQIWLSDGFTTVIEYDGEVTDAREEGLWHMAAYGSRLEDSQLMTKSYYTEAEPVALTVGFNNNRELYSKVNFDAMLSAVNGYDRSGDVTVTTVSGAKLRYRIHLVNSENDPKYSEADREALVSEISEIEGQIAEIREYEQQTAEFYTDE